MTNPHQDNFVLKSIESRIEQESQKLIEEAKKKLEKRTPEIVASVVVDMMKTVEMQTLQDKVVFTIRSKT